MQNLGGRQSVLWGIGKLSQYAGHLGFHRFRATGSLQFFLEHGLEMVWNTPKNNNDRVLRMKTLEN